MFLSSYTHITTFIIHLVRRFIYTTFHCKYYLAFENACNYAEKHIYTFRIFHIYYSKGKHCQMHQDPFFTFPFCIRRRKCQKEATRENTYIPFQYFTFTALSANTVMHHDPIFYFFFLY